MTAYSYNYEYFSMSAEQLTEELNRAREFVTKQMLADKEITQEQFDKLIRKYTIVVTRASILGKLWSKIKGEKEQYSIIILTVPTNIMSEFEDSSTDKDEENDVTKDKT